MDSVLTLRDLESWSRPGVALAVLGDPIGHSISPVMHNAALADLARNEARFADWEYFRFQVPATDLRRALPLLHAARFRGINLTIPHKVLAFELVNEVAPTARPVGAVNTLVWSEAGWIGNNTDGYGLTAGLRETLGIEISGAHILLLGAGGAARSAAVECLQRGCASLNIANRTGAHREGLLDALTAINPTIPRRAFALDNLPGDLPAGVVVINATSAGLRTTDAAPIDLQRLKGPVSVFDMIYNPPQTRLLREAELRGIPQANGLSMLVHQGAKALELWSGIPASRTAPIMKRAAAAALPRL